MSKRTRRHHTPDQKINILRRHHLEKVPVSEVCEAAELQPSVFYHWQRHLFEHGAQAFGESRRRAETSREQALEAEVERLKAKLARKDEVIAEVTEELVKVKKSVGEP
jgi:transposase